MSGGLYKICLNINQNNNINITVIEGYCDNLFKIKLNLTNNRD